VTTADTDIRDIRAIRYGILQSMLRIRKQLMRPGEWADPTILPLDTIEHRLVSDGYMLTIGLVAWAAHEHTVRWTLRQEGRA
jgi:hypothetical protein